LRAEQEGGSAILITNGTRTSDAPLDGDTPRARVVLRYEPRDRILTVVKPDVWDRSTSAAIPCLTTNVHGRFQIKPEREHSVAPLDGTRLHFDGKRVVTLGEADLGLIPTDQGRVTVISALRFQPAHMFPMFGQPAEVEGCYFQLMFSPANAEPVGQTIHLPFPYRSANVCGAMSPIKEYALYAADGMARISVVHLNLELEKQSELENGQRKN
jgi:hypothetical protein